MKTRKEKNYKNVYVSFSESDMKLLDELEKNAEETGSGLAKYIKFLLRYALAHLAKLGIKDMWDLFDAKLNKLEDDQKKIKQLEERLAFLETKDKEE